MFDEVIRYALTDIADKDGSGGLSRDGLYYPRVVVVVVVIMRLRVTS